MTKPYAYTDISTNPLQQNKSFQLFSEDEPICIFESCDTKMIESLVTNLNAAFNLGKELGKQSMFTKELYTYGIEIKNIYSLNINETYDEFLDANVIDYEIILPDASTHILPGMQSKTASTFINLMNHAHRSGFSEGLSYVEPEYNKMTIPSV